MASKSHAVFWLAAGALLVTGTYMYAVSETEAAEPRRALEANPRKRVRKRSVGLAVDSEGGLYVEDWPQWMEFAPDAFEEAIADGELGAENVLLHVLQRALPRLHWPPPEGTRQEEQYRELVKVVAEWLTMEPEPETTGLHVVN